MEQQKLHPNEMQAPGQVCYEAHWQKQSVFISAQCQSAHEWQWHCLASAILLERLEDACVLAETLLESPLQFFVSEVPGSRVGGASNSQDYLQVMLTTETDEVEIWLPVIAHQALMQHGELIDKSKLRWSSMNASLCIGCIALGHDDMARLKQGSLLLIPASWNTNWLCELEVPQLEYQIKATLDPMLGVLNVEPQTKISKKSSPAKETLINVYLEQDIDIDPGCLFGTKKQTENTDNNNLPIDLSLAQARCHCRIDSKLSFLADLLPVGDGYGLSVGEFL